MSNQAADSPSNQPSNHDEFHSSNAFCGNAGPEELDHLQFLLDALNDQEIIELTDAVNIDFESPTAEVPREILEGTLDEADREDFYREYHKILAKRQKPLQNNQDSF